MTAQPRRAIVLLSGGLDSATTLAIAAEQRERPGAEQRHARPGVIDREPRLERARGPQRDEDRSIHGRAL